MNIENFLLLSSLFGLAMATVVCFGKAIRKADESLLYLSAALLLILFGESLHVLFGDTYNMSGERVEDSVYLLERGMYLGQNFILTAFGIHIVAGFMRIGRVNQYKAEEEKARQEYVYRTIRSAIIISVIILLSFGAVYLPKLLKPTAIPGIGLAMDLRGQFPELKGLASRGLPAYLSWEDGKRGVIHEGWPLKMEIFEVPNIETRREILVAIESYRLRHHIEQILVEFRHVQDGRSEIMLGVNLPDPKWTDGAP